MNKFVLIRGLGWVVFSLSSSFNQGETISVSSRKGNVEVILEGRIARLPNGGYLYSILREEEHEGWRDCSECDLY